MKRINFTGIIIFFIALSVNGQNTGFGGRRCLIKVNAVNGTYGFLNGAQAELLLHRNITLSVGYDFINANVKQTYTDGEVVTGGKVTMDHKADVSYTGFNMEVRKYFSDIPAPHGFYLRAAYRKGNLNVNEGSFSSNLFDNGSPSQTITYSLTGVPVNSGYLPEAILVTIIPGTAILLKACRQEPFRALVKTLVPIFMPLINRRKKRNQA